MDNRTRRRYRDVEPPLPGHFTDERTLKRAAVAWAAVALCLMIILSISFGIGHEPKLLAAKDRMAQATPRLTLPALPATALRRQ